jgi:hypothetical protein
MDERVNAMLTQALLERTKWDEAPEVYFVVDDGATVHLETLGISDYLWRVAKDPVQMLMAMTMAMLEHPEQAVAALRCDGSVIPEGMVGIAFRSECWGTGIFADMPDETRERLQRAVATHTLHAQPERVEQRFALAYLVTDDAYYSVFQTRGEQPAPLPAEGEAEGRIPETLAALFMGFRLAAEGLRE